jgi:hypothetical protein
MRRNIRVTPGYGVNESSCVSHLVQDPNGTLPQLALACRSDADDDVVTFD